MKKVVITKETIDIACLGCERRDRPYHAKGLCKACYIAKLRENKRNSEVINTP